MDDIVERLRQHIKHPRMVHSTHWDGCIDSHPTCALAWALDEVERLQAQVRSQALELLVAHSENLGLYDLTMGEQHTPDETGVISQQHGDCVEEDNHE
jgi:hypothetical protein